MGCHALADVMSPARQEANDRGIIARHGLSWRCRTPLAST
jgi:hypothetical protein